MDDKTVNDLTSGCMYFIFIVGSVGGGVLAFWGCENDADDSHA
jgi:hypothetical protein